MKKSKLPPSILVGLSLREEKSVKLRSKTNPSNGHLICLYNSVIAVISPLSSKFLTKWYYPNAQAGGTLRFLGSKRFLCVSLINPIGD